MNENISVEKALNRGTLQLAFMPILIIVAVGAFSGYMNHLNIFKTPETILSIIAGFALGWFYWSNAVVNWKIWAYENVRNVHELKRKAIERNLIWSDGSWFEKTERKSQEQRRKLKYLEKKFLIEDVYFDNLAIPKETKIYYSKPSQFFLLIMGLGFNCLVFWLYLTTEKLEGYSYFLVPIGIWLIFSSVKKLLTKNPQLVLNDTGITISNNETFSWFSISNENIISKQHGKHRSQYLSFNSNRQLFEIQIDELGISSKKIEKLIRVYRVRYKKKIQFKILNNINSFKKSP
jgi:hypothetical protein